MDIQSGIFAFGLLWLMLWQFYESPFLGSILVAITIIIFYNIYHYININNTTIQTLRQEAQNFYQKILIMLDIFNNNRVRCSLGRPCTAGGTA